MDDTIVVRFTCRGRCDLCDTEGYPLELHPVKGWLCRKCANGKEVIELAVPDHCDYCGERKFTVDKLIDDKIQYKCDACGQLAIEIKDEEDLLDAKD